MFMWITSGYKVVIDNEMKKTIIKETKIMILRSQQETQQDPFVYKHILNVPEKYCET